MDPLIGHEHMTQARVRVTADSEPPILSIGTIHGDWTVENKTWDVAIRDLAGRVIRLRAGVVSPLRLNVVFFTSGKYHMETFEGVRTGRFSRKDSHLMVQAAAPPGVAENRRDVLAELLSDSVDEAEAFARKRGIADSLDAIRAIVEQAVAE